MRVGVDAVLFALLLLHPVTPVFEVLSRIQLLLVSLLLRRRRAGSSSFFGVSSSLGSLCLGSLLSLLELLERIFRDRLYRCGRFTIS